jgi:hypothetical protein
MKASETAALRRRSKKAQDLVNGIEICASCMLSFQLYLKAKARSVVQDRGVKPWSTARSNLHEFV